MSNAQINWEILLHAFSSYLQNAEAFNDFLERISDVKKRRKQSYLDNQKKFFPMGMGRTSGTVTVKTENSLDISWIPYFFDLRMKQWKQRKCRNLNFKLFCLSLTIKWTQAL